MTELLEVVGRDVKNVAGYALAGKIFWGTCGAPMIEVSSYSCHNGRK